MYEDFQQKDQGFSNNEILIVKVDLPELDTIKGHHTYLVSGQDKHGPFQIRRRFNDFYYLRESLKKKYGALYIPPIPEKLITGNKDEGIIEIRKKFLNYFMQRIANNVHLFYSIITSDFLRNKNIDMQKFFTTMPPTRPQQVISLLRQIYSDVNQNMKAMIQKNKNISQFSLYLKKADRQLRTIKNTMYSIVEARNNFLQNLNICNLSILPQYQKNVFSEYLSSEQKQQGLIFAKNIKVQQNVKKLKENSTENSFEAFLDMINYEIRQIQAMSQLISDKQAFQNHLKKIQEKLQSSQSQLAKLSGGKTTFKSIFSKGNKQQQIQTLSKQIPSMKIQSQKWRQFINFIIIIITEKEIPKFRNFKKIKYYQMVNLTSQKQLKHLSIYGQLMKSVMQSLITIK